MDEQSLSTMAKAEQSRRNKTFDECKPEEQIRRLRQVILNLQHQLTYVAQTAHRADRTASRHQHSAQTGDVMVLPTDDQGHAGRVAENSFDPLR